VSKLLSLIQSRECNKFQKLHNCFVKHGTVNSTQIPFAEEVKCYNTSFTLFQGYLPDKGASCTVIIPIITAQHGSGNKIEQNINDICVLYAFMPINTTIQIWLQKYA